MTLVHRFEALSGNGRMAISSTSSWLVAKEVKSGSNMDPCTASGHAPYLKCIVSSETPWDALFALADLNSES